MLESPSKGFVIANLLGHTDHVKICRLLMGPDGFEIRRFHYCGPHAYCVSQTSCSAKYPIEHWLEVIVVGSTRRLVCTPHDMSQSHCHDCSRVTGGIRY
jgi:hypothetical protein